jgi:hypothetical protein
MKKINQANPRARGKRGGKEGRGGGGRDALSPGAVANLGESRRHHSRGREVVLHLRAAECEVDQEGASPLELAAKGSAATLHVITVADKAPRCAGTRRTWEPWRQQQQAGWWPKMISGCGGVAGYPRGSAWIGCGMG